jgi:hypothetical protein
MKTTHGNGVLGRALCICATLKVLNGIISVYIVSPSN